MEVVVVVAAAATVMPVVVVVWQLLEDSQAMRANWFKDYKLVTILKMKC